MAILPGVPKSWATFYSILSEFRAGDPIWLEAWPPLGDRSNEATSCSHSAPSPARPDHRDGWLRLGLVEGYE
jgi:hypothetical protein